MQRELTADRPVITAGLARMGLLVALALLIPNLGLSQPITGTLVNALLLLSVEWAGVGTAMMVGMVTPVAAALRGVLPLPLLVMVPFIALSNATLVNIYNSLRSRQPVGALVVAAVAKFALLFGAVTILVAHPLVLGTAAGAQAIKIPLTIVQMMQWPQLATALAGGVLAFGVRWTAGRLVRR